MTPEGREWIVVVVFLVIMFVIAAIGLALVGPS